MKRTGIALLSTAALLAASGAMAASADDISWTYLEAGWVNADGYEDFETDGFAINGSLGFADNFYLQAGFSALDSDWDDADIDTWNVAIGYHTNLTATSQWFIDVGYFDGEYDYDGAEGFDGGTADTDGFSVSSGVRIRPTDSMEFGAKLVYTDGDIEGSDFNDTSVGVYGQYYLVPAWSVGLAASLSGGGGGITAGAGDSISLYTRYDFGNIF